MMDMKRVEEIENMDIQLHKDKIDFLIQTIKQQQEQIAEYRAKYANLRVDSDIDSIAKDKQIKRYEEALQSISKKRISVYLSKNETIEDLIRTATKALEESE